MCMCSADTHALCPVVQNQRKHELFRQKDTSLPPYPSIEVEKHCQHFGRHYYQRLRFCIYATEKIIKHYRSWSSKSYSCMEISFHKMEMWGSKETYDNSYDPKLGISRTGDNRWLTTYLSLKRTKESNKQEADCLK